MPGKMVGKWVRCTEESTSWMCSSSLSDTPLAERQGRGNDRGIRGAVRSEYQYEYCTRTVRVDVSVDCSHPPTVLVEAREDAVLEARNSLQRYCK